MDDFDFNDWTVAFELTVNHTPSNGCCYTIQWYFTVIFIAILKPEVSLRW
jgi:hypothetical protein